jgi:hypothetical protein
MPQIAPVLHLTPYPPLDRRMAQRLHLSPTVQEPKRSQSTGRPQPVSNRPNPEQSQLLNEDTIDKKGSRSLAFRPLPVHL